jgi:hypothetical protein
MMKSLLLVPVLVAACADAPSYPVPSDSPSTPVAFDQLRVDGADAPIATGGIQVISIPDPTSVGWSGQASSGFAVEPYASVWPETQKPEYHVVALADGSGTFSIQTQHGIASGQVTSADVARVDAQPAGNGLIEVALYDRDGHRLIDGSLAIHDQADPTAVQRAWDQLAVAATPGTHSLVVTADSIPQQLLTVTLP